MIEELEALELIRIILALKSIIIIQKPRMYMMDKSQKQSQYGLHVFWQTSRKIRTSLKAFYVIVNM